MSIELTCPSCERRFKVAGEHAGKRVKCPGCKTVLQIPAAEAPEPKAPTPSSFHTPLAEHEAPFPAINVGGRSSAGAHAASASPYTVSAGYASDGPPLTDSQRTAGTISVACGGISIAGALLTFFGGCCCGLLWMLGPVMIIPSSVGLFMATKTAGNYKVGGFITNGIGLALSIIATILLIAFIALYGVIILSNNNAGAGGGGFVP